MKSCRIVLLSMALLALVSGSGHAATEITLESIDGLWTGDSVLSGNEVKFTFRMTYTPGDGSFLSGSNNGFRVWTHQSGVYSDAFVPITYDTLPIGWDGLYDGMFINAFGVDGVGADTVGFGGFTAFFGSESLKDPFNTTVWWIATTPTGGDDTLCVDSSWYPPDDPWLWAAYGGDVFPPDWDGPHCVAVIPCCIGDRGNVNMDQGTNIADVTFLGYYLFKQGEAPPCPEGGDVNGDGHINVIDLTFLIDYLFRQGAAPATCP